MRQVLYSTQKFCKGISEEWIGLASKLDGNIKSIKSF